VTSPNLERLARGGELKAETFDSRQLHALLVRAGELLSDSWRPHLSRQGRFGLAYGASHALATAALRLHGYRSGNRMLAFQCLEHTAGLSVGQCRLFCVAQERHDRAEYDGRFEVEEALVESLIEATDNLLMRIQGMSPPP